MDRSSVITLIKTTYSQDEIGQQVAVETRRPAFCDLRSVSRSEWATAGQLGLNPELVATMFAPDYRGEEIVEISISGISEAVYLTDEELRLLFGAEKQALRADEEDEPADPGTAIRYGVYRTYRDRNENIELYLERKAGVANG